MANDDAREVPGWWGKLAGLGDFAHRRLPPEWIRVCDGWLSAALRGSREHLGEQWLQAYLTAPVLRFAWAPGVIDPQWWFGVLMPSCDSVGRYFPLLIAQPRAHPPQERIALDHLEAWFERLAQAALGTLHAGPDTIEALDAALREAPPWPAPGEAPRLAVQQREHGERLRLGRDTRLAEWLHALAARELARRLDGRTLWWRDGGDAPAIEIIPGLPDGWAFANLLTAS